MNRPFVPFAPSAPFAPSVPFAPFVRVVEGGAYLCGVLASPLQHCMQLASNLNRETLLCTPSPCACVACGTGGHVSLTCLQLQLQTSAAARA